MPGLGAELGESSQLRGCPFLPQPLPAACSVSLGTGCTQTVYLLLRTGIPPELCSPVTGPASFLTSTSSPPLTRKVRTHSGHTKATVTDTRRVKAELPSEGLSHPPSTKAEWLHGNSCQAWALTQLPTDNGQWLKFCEPQFGQLSHRNSHPYLSLLF